MQNAFPSLLIHADRLEAQGSFAEAQATWLNPDPAAVAELAALLEAGSIGVVAHFYMDVELQGVLTACPWPHIHISDSLAMADRAVAMAEAGMKAIVVLGVDFMSENVRAVLDAAGHAEVPVYRLSAKEIGCSLAASAETRSYAAWLDQAAHTPRSLHVVYINTSLITKAKAHAQVPTITCTSSNVVRTVLEAFAEIEDLELWYGPDTYMGHNLERMFQRYAELPAEEIRRLHPAHDADSLRSLVRRFHTFPQGNCVVHHLFGAEVVERVRREHPDAFYTAHLEVPGEMFELAVEAQRQGRGVTGSTSDILGFIVDRLQERIHHPGAQTLSFVLGTEAGMITSIVDRVQRALAESGRDDLAVEIVFPVASEAVAADEQLGVLPGVAGGEGCSTAGGCATCPYMKMNSLEALFDVLEALAEGRPLVGFAPRVYTERIAGRSAADLGSEPILHMRDFQRTGHLPEALVRAVLQVGSARTPTQMDK